MKIIILAAGIGSRLGNPFPKSLTPLVNGKTIMQQQIDNLTSIYSIDDVNIIVGFKKELIMDAHSDASFIYNNKFAQTNTSKSLLCGLKKMQNESVLWLDGDVVFDEAMLKHLDKYIKEDKSFVSVNNSKVSDEEIKYTLQSDGAIKDISKEVVGGLGEAVGVNFISKNDIKAFINRLEECNNNDYYEKAFELGIEKDDLKLIPVNISDFICMEIDFKEDLDAVNKLIK